MKITIQSIKDKTVFTMDDDLSFLKSLTRCIEKNSTIEISVDLKTYLINPRNIVWIEISEMEGA